MRGMVAEPGAGLMSKSPYGVCLKFTGSVVDEANAGRSLKIRSPLVSKPVVMLKKFPVLAMMNGFKAIFSFGIPSVPPRKKLWRGMKGMRPRSALMS